MEASSVVRQVLLIPEIIELSSSDISSLIAEKEQLLKSGLVLEEFGENAVIIHETPALLGDFNVESLILDIFKLQFNIGGPAMIALTRVRSNLHFSEECIHFFLI